MPGVGWGVWRGISEGHSAGRLPHGRRPHRRIALDRQHTVDARSDRPRARHRFPEIREMRCAQPQENLQRAVPIDPQSEDAKDGSHGVLTQHPFDAGPPGKHVPRAGKSRAHQQSKLSAFCRPQRGDMARSATAAIGAGTRQPDPASARLGSGGSPVSRVERVWVRALWRSEEKGPGHATGMRDPNPRIARCAGEDRGPERTSCATYSPPPRLLAPCWTGCARRRRFTLISSQPTYSRKTVVQRSGSGPRSPPRHRTRGTTPRAPP